MNIQEIKDQISSAKDTAKREANKYYSCVRSRGNFFYCSIDGGDNLFEADCFEWDKTKKQIISTIADIKQKYNGHEICFGIQGGFDGSDSVYGLHNDEYDPLVSEWFVEIPI